MRKIRNAIELYDYAGEIHWAAMLVEIRLKKFDENQDDEEAIMELKKTIAALAQLLEAQIAVPTEFYEVPDGIPF